MTRYVPMRLTKLVQSLPASRRAWFFRQVVIAAAPEPHRQRFMVRGLLPLLMPFMLDVDAAVRGAAHATMDAILAAVRAHDGEDCTAAFAAPSDVTPTPTARTLHFPDVGVRRTVSGAATLAAPTVGPLKPATMGAAKASVAPKTTGRSTPAATTTTTPGTSRSPTSKAPTAVAAAVVGAHESVGFPNEARSDWDSNDWDDHDDVEAWESPTTAVSRSAPSAPAAAPSPPSPAPAARSAPASKDKPKTGAADASASASTALPAAVAAADAPEPEVDYFALVDTLPAAAPAVAKPTKVARPLRTAAGRGARASPAPGRSQPTATSPATPTSTEANGTPSAASHEASSSTTSS